MGYERPMACFFVRARAYMSLIAFAAAFLAPVALVSFSFAGADVPALVAGLKAPTAQEREQAIQGLIAAGAPAVKPVLATVRDDRSRFRAQRILTAMGAKTAVPELLSALRDASISRNAGSLLFSVIGPESADKAPELLACARELPEVRNYCGDALFKIMSPKASGQVKSLTAALADKEPAVRSFAAAALGRVGRKASAAVPALSKALTDSDVKTRVLAAQALGGIGGAAKDAAPALQAAAQHDSNEAVRKAAEEALKTING